MDMFYPPSWREEDKLPDDYDPNAEVLSEKDKESIRGDEKYHQMVDEGEA